MKNDIHDLGLVLESRVKLVVIESWDEPRVLETLTSLAIKRGLGIYTWAVTEGLQRLAFGGEPVGEQDSREPEQALRLIKADPTPNLYVMCDLHPFLVDDPKLVRLLKEIAMNEAPHKPTLVLVSHAVKLPAEVQRYAARFSLALPTEEELLAIVREEATRWSERNRGARVRTDNRTLQQVVKNLRGMSHAEARALARNLICDDGAITQEDLPELNKAKFQLLDLEGVLSFEHDTARFAEVGGLANLKRWLGERQDIFLNGKGEDMPKGMLLVGVQGGGKSLAAKAVAASWQLPLFRMDFGALHDKWQGESERKLREALRTADSMQPCVLWMDEVEKGLSGGGAGEAEGSGATRRMLGTLLTWMAERRSRVFLVATANHIESLPPELVRKGRFDEIFFVDLPAPEVRQGIFRIHLGKHRIAFDDAALAPLVERSEGFSGAEIEAAVVAARYEAHARGEPPQPEAVMRELLRTRPLSVTRAEAIDELRAWAADRTVSAD